MKYIIPKNTTDFSEKKVLYSLMVLLACVVLSSCHNTTTAQTLADQPNAIDLGLSVLWADRNIGADSPTAYGDYFAWGEIKPKDRYSWSSYKYCNDGDYHKLTKYCAKNNYGNVVNKEILDPEDDAAVQNLGNGWRMPTIEEYKEFLDNCDWKWTTKDGVNGSEFTSKKNGNKIFFPAAGLKGQIFSNTDSYGNFWSSSLYSDDPSNAQGLYFDSGYADLIDWYGRCNGFPVRAVRSKN